MRISVVGHCMISLKIIKMDIYIYIYIYITEMSPHQDFQMRMNPFCYTLYQYVNKKSL
jgi:hypothetical protein